MILKSHGYELNISMLEYLEALMRKISERQAEHAALYQELFLPMRTAEMLRALTDNDILLFKAQPSSLKEHALKKKIIYLMNRVLVKEGVAFNAKAWDAVTEAIEVKKKKLAAQVRLYVNTYKSELKERLCEELPLSEISHYFIEHPEYNIERQKARAQAFAVFTRFLRDKEDRIKQEPYFEKVTLYKEGNMWESRYWVMLDEIMRELTQKAWGREITEGGDMKRALDTIPELRRTTPFELFRQNTLKISRAI